jgi:hypothetical protein
VASGSLSLYHLARLCIYDWDLVSHYTNHPGYTRTTLNDYAQQLLIVDDPSSASKAKHIVADELQRTQGSIVLGFDVETKPTFVKGHTEPAALLQIAMRTHVFLVCAKSTHGTI